MTAPTLFDRKQALQQAARLVRGRFLEGADLFTNEDGYMTAQAERCAVAGARVLLALARVQEETGEPATAFDTLCRAVRFAPDNAEVARLLVRVGEEIGRGRGARQLLADNGVTDLVRSPQPKTAGSGLLPASPLPPSLRRILESLCVFDAPFPPDWATQLDADATPENVTALTKAGYLYSTDGNRNESGWLAVPGTMREDVWKTVASTRRRELKSTFFPIVLKQLYALHYKHPDAEHRLSGLYPAFTPHFAAVMADIVHRKPTNEYFDFVGTLNHSGHTALVDSAHNWVETTASRDDLNLGLRFKAVHVAATVALSRNDFPAAARWFKRYLSLPELSQPEARNLSPSVAGNLAALVMTLHHAADAEQAIYFAREAVRVAEASGDSFLVSCALFAFAESGYATGYLNEALAATQRCVAIRRNLLPPRCFTGLAAALYQNGCVRYVAGDRDEAIAAWNEAIPLFHETNEENGVADCMRSLAQARLAADAVGEALLYATQARAIYERLSVLGSRAAILETLGDIAKAQNKPFAARALYRQSLDYWVSVAHPRWSARLEARLVSMPPDAQPMPAFISPE